MSRSNIVTLIPLDNAANVLGVNPYHFNSIFSARYPENSSCDDFWFDSAFQRVGQAGREDLARALYQAERQVLRYLKYPPMPTWIINEEQRITKPYAVDLGNWRRLNSRGQYKSVRTTFGNILETGTRAKTLIQAGAAVVYSDADGDGYNELATVTVATSVTDPQQIYAYFAGKSGNDAWEIRPISVSISGGNATITFQRYLVPLPDLWTRLPSADDPVVRAIDGDNIANFITTADVYRVYTDTTDQATLSYEDAGSQDCVDCEFDTESACLKIRDARLGVLAYAPAEWNETTGQFDFSSDHAWDADKILLNYRAGYVNHMLDAPYRQMDPEWERAIVYYAFTLLERADNVCGNAENVRDTMREDLALAEGGRSHTLAFKNLQNPLGTTRAAINLWRMIERERLI